MNKFVKVFVVIVTLFLFAAGGVFAQDTSLPEPTPPTPTPIASPTDPPNMCNGTCGSDSNCQPGLVCYGESGSTTKYCRNPSCQSQTNCTCPTTTATPTKTPSPRPSVKPTITPTLTPTIAPTKSPEETEEPSPTATAGTSGGGVNIRGIAIGSLIVGFLIIVGGILYLKFKNKGRVPPIGVFDP